MRIAIKREQERKPVIPKMSNYYSLFMLLGLNECFIVETFGAVKVETRERDLGEAKYSLQIDHKKPSSKSN
jgi:hypothetical protein